MAASNPAALLKDADEAIARNDPREAIRIYKTFLSQHRSHPRVLRVRSRVVTLYTRLGEYDEAVAVGERAGAGVEKDIDLLYAIAQANMYGGRLRQATETLERCLAVDPDHAASIARMAVVLMSQKRADEALKTVEAAWARGIETWDLDHVFAQLAPGAARVGEAIDRLRVRVDEPGLTPAARSGVSMALATLLEKEGDYAGSWAAAVRANRIVRTGWNADLHRQGLDETIAAYSADAFDAMAPIMESVEPRDRLVFVVGMPRSGTTLIDQVLSAHPGAESVGESRCLELAAASVRLETPDPRVLARLTGAKRSAAGAALRASMGAITGTDGVLIDKTPFNDRRVGALASFAPGARIIITRRDPRDTALSCFFRNFASGMEWSADMGWITEIIRERMRLHAHWLGVLPAHAPWVSVTQARYESLVSEAEPQARRLVEFAGLPWDDACLRFSERKRMLPTLEPGQAGQGVYTGSVARWRRFEPHAEGAFDALHAIAEELGYEPA
tara:strand:- start:23424 stop:24932 length:1509 start_codon:yes stop_codon:yes gene_type:complete